jgi:hypothetical protein
MGFVYSDLKCFKRLRFAGRQPDVHAPSAGGETGQNTERTL